MDDELKSLAAGFLDGSRDGEERLSDRLKADPAAFAEFVDQVQMHHRLGVLLREDDPVTTAVVRELRLLPDASRFSREVVDRVKQLEPAGRRSLRLLPLWAAAAVFLAILSVLIFRQAPPAVVAARPQRVLFIAGQVPPGPGDAAVLARLEQLRFAVTLKSSRQVVATDAAQHDLVLISSTSLAEDVVDPAAELQIRFRDVPVPLLTWEPRLLHDLGMIEGSTHGKDWASTRSSMSLTLLRTDHPLAAGMSGSPRVAKGPDRCSWGRARADAIRIAAVEGEASHAAIFGYEQGAAMPGLVAPARRLSFFLFDHTAPSLTPEGWALFDAAVRWCAGAPKE